MAVTSILLAKVPKLENEFIMNNKNTYSQQQNLNLLNMLQYSVANNAMNNENYTNLKA